jgi:hypothetical protein
MRFSVGVTSGVVDGVVVVLDGLSGSFPPQAVNAAIDTMAATPRIPAVRRVCILCIQFFSWEAKQELMFLGLTERPGP